MFIFRKKKDLNPKGSQTPAGRSSSELPSFTSVESSLARVIALENILVGGQKQTRQNSKTLEKRHIQVLMSEKVSFADKSNIFHSFISSNKLNPKLLEILFEWRYKYMNKKKFLLLLLEVISNNILYFENTEINELVDMVCQCCENSDKVSSTQESYKLTAFFFISRIIHLDFTFWTESLTRTLCKCFSAKKSFDVFSHLLKSSAYFIQMNVLVKVLEEDETRFNALAIMKEVMKEKGKNEKFKDFMAQVMLTLLRCKMNEPEKAMAEELIRVAENDMDLGFSAELLDEVKKWVRGKVD